MRYLCFICIICRYSLTLLQYHCTTFHSKTSLKLHWAHRVAPPVGNANDGSDLHRCDAADGHLSDDLRVPFCHTSSAARSPPPTTLQTLHFSSLQIHHNKTETSASESVRSWQIDGRGQPVRCVSCHANVTSNKTSLQHRVLVDVSATKPCQHLSTSIQSEILTALH